MSKVKVEKVKKIEKKEFEPKILVFACNWCSYAGADNAGVSRIEYSPNVRILRTMCSGRVHPSFVLKAFAEGSDGVMVSGCHFGDCHYMFGNYKAVDQFDKLKNLAKLLGLEPGRIALEWVSAAEGPRFGKVINEFVDQIKKLGPSPFIKNGYEPKPPDIIDLTKYHLYECLECGKCTGVCPVARTHKFSPRRSISKSISKGIDAISGDASIWACLTCKRCEQVCPSNIPYSSLNRDVRVLTREKGIQQTCTHGGVFEQINLLMTSPDIKQDRLGWITDDLKYSTTKGDTLFFTGCSPYFAAYFGEPFEDHLSGSMRSAVRLMNKLGIEPLIMPNELCCGHDFILRGEKEKFDSIAKRVYKQIKDSGVKRIVFSCPECLVTFKDDYPKIVGDMGIEMIHLSELVESEKEKIKFKEKKQKYTYQDPCRLGRYAGIYAQPRNIINEIPGTELVEMAHNKNKASCCGNTAWIGCDAGTKTLQRKRLAEAADTGTDLLLTACPKCFIHLTCSQEGEKETPGGSVKIMDMWEFVADQIE